LTNSENNRKRCVSHPVRHGDLTIEQVVRVARFNHPVLEVGPVSSEISSQVVYDRVIASRSWVEDVISENAKKKR